MLPASLWAVRRAVGYPIDLLERVLVPLFASDFKSFALAGSGFSALCFQQSDQSDHIRSRDRVCDSCLSSCFLLCPVLWLLDQNHDVLN
jgi:hypothetical protein